MAAKRVQVACGFLGLGLLLAQSALADVPMHSPAWLKQNGYRPASSLTWRPATVADSVEVKRLAPPQIPHAEHSLPWPVAFADRGKTVANSMAQFQPFGSPYFHGGCDLRIARRAEVIAPVSGKIEAGHYDYENRPDGSMVKYFKPWPESGEALYFELAIVTREGFRFELHHVDRASLSPRVLDLLKAGGGEVSAGEVLARAVAWPSGDYDHIHYNVIDPSGIRINPEWVSPLILDTQPPKIQEALWVLKNGLVRPFGNGTSRDQPVELVLHVSDRKDGNPYEQPPVQARIEFRSGLQAGWDFSRFLGRADGSWAPIWDVLRESIRSPTQGTIRTEGGYGLGKALLRLPVPAGARGPFTVTLVDPAGNETLLSGDLQ